MFLQNEEKEIIYIELGSCYLAKWGKKNKSRK